jgi:pyruvate formate lyase activating enzyme
VEKKPLFHFYPGSETFSIATAGCNLHCKNCQNWEISQASPEQVTATHVPPEKVIELALKNKCRSIAYTYTDPVVFYEYAYDCSVKAHENGLKNILVTAGYINKGPLKELAKYADAAHFDLKAFSDKFYQEVCGATLRPVLDALVTAKSCGVWVEIINLIIPTLNDKDEDIEKLCKWIKENMGRDTPLHLSRFFPNYLMKNLPPTSLKTLENAKKIATDVGLDFVYIGNIGTENAENTYCPGCRNLLIKRRRYEIIKNNINAGKCPECKREISGIWT